MRRRHWQMFFYVDFRCSCSYWSKLLHCSLENTCTMEINLQKHFVIAKGLQKQSKQYRQSVLLDDVIKLWSPKWYIEIWATWDCRSLWCSRDLLAACTTELYTHSADLTAIVSYKRLSKLLKFGGGGLQLCKSGCLINFVTLKVVAFQCTQPSFHELL